MTNLYDSGRTAAVISLGCAKNLVDSEVMTGILNQNGYRFTEELEKADVLIINTCGFIKPAKDEAEKTIQGALDLKKKNRELQVVVTGCYVQRSGAELRKVFPGVDVWTGVSEFDRIIELIKGLPFEKRSRSYLYDHSSPRYISTSSVWAYVKISEGCSHSCSFCTIPLIKGKYHSRDISSIVQEVRDLSSRGIKEVNLVSQDSTFFGRDRGLKDGLVQLLQQLIDIPELNWIRILYGYPDEISDSLLEIMQNEKICSYLDIPFQHTSPAIMKSMNRGISGTKAFQLLEDIRKKLPDISLRTSLIVGFPGETEKEYDELVRFVKKACFDHLGIFLYSPEEETDCFALGDPIPEDVKLLRREKIMKIQAELSYANNQKYIGEKIEVLLEGPLEADPTVVRARSRFQAPEVDGLVFIDAEGTDLLENDPIRKVEITDRDVYDLYGTLAS